MLPSISYLIKLYSANISRCLELLPLPKSMVTAGALNRVRGRNIVVALFLHTTVLLTFGVACPVLGIVILVGMANRLIVSYLVTGRLLESNFILQEHSCDFSTGIFDRTGNEERSPDVLRTVQDRSNSARMGQTSIEGLELSHVSVFNDSFTKAPSKLPVSNPLHATVDHEPTFSRPETYSSVANGERYDFLDSWQLLSVCWPLIVVTVSVFWGLLFFDMVSDRYGYLVGGVASGCFCVSVPSLVFSCQLTMRSSITENARFNIHRYLRKLLCVDSIYSIDPNQSKDNPG